MAVLAGSVQKDNMVYTNSMGKQHYHATAYNKHLHVATKNSVTTKKIQKNKLNTKQTFKCQK